MGNDCYKKNFSARHFFIYSIIVTLSYIFRYGLPLSRLYARYFHGDLIVNSYDGYGTDAIVYLKAKETEAGELLPIFNKTSTKQYKAAIPTADWTDPGSSMNSSVHYHIGRKRFHPIENRESS